MSPNYCPVCREFVLSFEVGGHMCHPLFDCYELDNDPSLESPTEVRAFDAADAAEEFLERYDDDSAEWPEGPRIVVVRDRENGTESRFSVEWEMRRDYTARPL